MYSNYSDIVIHSFPTSHPRLPFQPLYQHKHGHDPPNLNLNPTQHNPPHQHNRTPPQTHPTSGNIVQPYYCAIVLFLTFEGSKKNFMNRKAKEFFKVINVRPRNRSLWFWLNFEREVWCSILELGAVESNVM